MPPKHRKSRSAHPGSGALSGVRNGGVRKVMVKPQPVSQARLQAVSNAARVGATTDSSRRTHQYSREGYRGRMEHAPTQNMKQAEERLLRENEMI